ncbi:MULTISPECIES: MFS transporter [Eubacterium]|jgi:fucose permease|uniref:MFS transporter n=1 Tax=Eubacterium album TaxID=2978477 RepID=A0ABT2M0X9_9FIRM|nr:MULTISPECIES: MFS transporter [unclassified Eubacterium (in: firmicutes)]MCT7398566.1 MFS transporter [Eubacterium sp. LFL-14]RGG65612.1 MFS transporter [Eubacterium sp. AF17-7]RHR35735.1 MFS transporter [Eubacterium sp. AF19-12LB]CDA29147.1 transporter major facilitator family protein [Eubacterium sp. CAG:156]
MVTLLLALIYLAFISLGLPDSLLGSAWPQMHLDLGAQLSMEGIISMLISCGTVISSLFSEKIIYKFGTGMISAVSTLLTAVALFGFSVSGNFYMLCFLAIPYGLGAGAIDAALNNYVALHFASRHMSWLHCFWGIGAAVGPYVMGVAMSLGKGWRGGYLAISVIQLVLTIVLFAALPLWKINQEKNEESITEKKEPKKLKEIFKIKGVAFVLIAFFCYCAVEQTTGLWASSYFVINRGLSNHTAASFVGLFYIGITGGRFLSGFIADKFGDKKMIRLGICGILIGVVFLLIPANQLFSSYKMLKEIFPLIGLGFVGFGCAPIYPSVIHATPDNFGKENSQAIIGIQMAFAYMGVIIMPALFGIISQYITIALFPIYIMLITLVMFIMSEKMNKLKSKI